MVKLPNLGPETRRKGVTSNHIRVPILKISFHTRMVIFVSSARIFSGNCRHIRSDVLERLLKDIISVTISIFVLIRGMRFGGRTLI